MTHQQARHHDHAIVLGASMGGLAAAQALSRHFQRVTVIERDRLADHPAPRPGVPQGRHLHVLLPGGRDALENLFPEFGDGLVAAGAVPVGAPDEILWLNPCGWVGRFPERHSMLSASRNLIEWYTRRRLLESPGVTIEDGLSVTGLVAAPIGSGVCGVFVQASTDSTSRTPAEGSRAMRADLVVDTTGRRSRTPDWLDRLGYERPEETKIDAGLAYATRVFQCPPRPRDWKAVFLQASPPATSRMGVLFPIEGDRWIVTLQGAGGDHPPTDDQGFLDFARSLRSTVIYDAIRDANPLTPTVAFANTSNRRRHYDKMRAWPEQFVAMGDNACAFNPVYGQGMGVAAQTAVELDRQLARHARRRRDLDGFAQPMQRRVAATGKAAWMIATGDDLRMPTTTSTAGAGSGRMMRIQHRYLDRVIAAATGDETVLAAVMEAFFLLSPPESLFRPSILLRTLRRRPAAEPAPSPALAMSSSR
jgi:2-polyprenyl-6-methoxyphenol hydroxylase-like FAD-dependent oxidoreductase